MLNGQDIAARAITNSRCCGFIQCELILVTSRDKVRDRAEIRNSVTQARQAGDSDKHSCLLSQLVCKRTNGPPSAIFQLQYPSRYQIRAIVAINQIDLSH